MDRDESRNRSSFLTRVAGRLRRKSVAVRRALQERLPYLLPVWREIHATTGKHTLAVGYELITAWSGHGLKPRMFTANMLWDVAAERWGDFVSAAQIAPFFSKTLDPQDRALSRDKASFAQFDRKHGLPWLPTLAVIHRTAGVPIEGAAVVATPDQLLQFLEQMTPANGLVLKPSCGQQGRGFFHVSPLTRAQDGDGREVSLDEVARRVFTYRHRLGNYGYLAQQAMKPLPALTDLTGVTNLSTVRVVTAFRGGAVRPVYIVLKIPATGRLIDNFGGGVSGTLVSGVDPTTGRLGKVIGLLRPHQRFVLERSATHPTTGRLIEGQELPLWKDVVELAYRAAALHPGTATLGWDIALTSEGLVILDGNPTWNPELGQACMRRGLRPFFAALYPELWS
jgi:hypothetical protein